LSFFLLLVYHYAIDFFSDTFGFDTAFLATPNLTELPPGILTVVLAGPSLVATAYL
jgi:hypothetical protein